MGVYRYTAAAPTGGRRRGELVADSAYQVRAALRRMGLAPVRVVESGAPSGAARTAGSALPLRRWAAQAARRRRSALLADMFERLAALLATGTRLAPALELLARAAGKRGRCATLCRLLADRVKQGASLADALAERPEWFSPIDVALVRAAERSGELDRTLSDLADHHARSDELRGRIAGALAYPTLLLVFGVAVVVFLTTTTLPQLAAALADAGAAPPPSTAALLAIGGVLAAHPAAALLAALAPLTALVWAWRTPRLARLRLRVPLFGALISRSETAAISLLLARLLRGGVTLTDALELAAPTARNSALSAALRDLAPALRGGRSASAAFADSGLFDPVFRQIVEVGEESGELPAALESVGERYRASARRLVDRLAATLEPAAILALAAMVGFVVYAAIAPILRLAQTL